MITEQQLIEVGYIAKLHGLKGEMQARITDSVIDDVERCPYLVCEIDGIYVPFFLDSFRFRSSESALLKFEDIDSAEKAEPFCGLKLYFDRKCFSPEEQKQYDQKAEDDLGLIGYKIIDKTLGPIGEITDINDLTENVLFIVDHDGDEIMIPAADDLILAIDDENATILMDLPEGLVNIEDAETEE
ncbi:MAG: 16S rRNA processing protein RimM [Bacteroidales bacterium]|nr:16S rRNA processing protein RimM [Bacteroidales bacterium]